MKKIAILLLTGILAWGCDIIPVDDPDFELNTKSSEVVNTNNDFGFEILNTILENEDAANVMISPASISLALGMAYNGAETTTRAAFDSVLNYEGLTMEEVNTVSRDLIRTLVTNVKDNTLEIANSVWHHQDFPVYQSYIDLNKTYYDAEVSELDFGDPATVDAINDWVKDKTHDKILKIIDDLSPDARMVLINALYFNCMWETEFDKDETTEEPFFSDDGVSQGDVTMMKTESTFNYASTEAFTAVELPYKNDKFSMHLFLPKSGKSVDELIGEMDGDTWNSWLEGYTETDEVQVIMPKFKFDYKREMGPDLIDMGLGEAFSSQADFSGISEIDLLISRVIHKTYIDVNEEGTEAAAVTAVVFEVTSVGPSGPVIVKFDRPFFFAITENSSNSIVFAGKVSQPEYDE